MKKGTIVALIVAAVLIAIGGTVLMLGLSFAGDSEAAERTQQDVIIQENFEDILIKTEDYNVTFAMFSGRADTQVTFIGATKNVSHSVTVEDGVLKIKMTDNRKWYDKIGIFWEEMDMVIYLPESQYKSLEITTATGDIEVPEMFYFEEVQLRSDTGEVDFSAAVADTLSGWTATGDLEIMGSTPQSMDLNSDTGDISLYAVNTGGEFHIKTDTGSIELEKVTCQMLHCDSATGDIELEQVIAEVYLQAFNDTGDVVVTNCDAGTVNIETATGDVSGNFLTPKKYAEGAISHTGKVTVPNTREGGECRIETDTGDIHFE